MRLRAPRPALATAGAAVAAQTVAAVAQFLRIPITVNAIGVAPTGDLLIINAIGGWLFIPAYGMRDQARADIAVCLAQKNPHSARSVVVRTRRTAMRMVLVLSALTALSLTTFLVLANPSPRQAAFAWGLAITVVVSASASLWSADLATLEATGRTAAANALVAWVAVSLPATYLVLQFTASLAWLATIAAFASILPFAAAWFLARRVHREWEGQPKAGWRTTDFEHSKPLPFVLSSGALMIGGGFDAVLIGTLVDSTAVAVVGIAGRILLPLTMIPLALQPRMASALAADRGRGDPRAFHRRLRRYIAQMCGLCMLGAALLLPVYPTVFGWVADGQASSPPGLYLAMALGKILACAVIVLAAAASSPRAIRTSWRISLAGSIAGIATMVAVLPLFGIVGASWARSAVAGAQLGVWWSILRRHRGLLIEESS